jgi:hypothetical protein
MKNKIIKAVSEVHSGNRAEAEKIASIVMEIYQPILQTAAHTMVIAGVEILQLNDKEAHVHAQPLFDAADIVQNWIKH